MTNRRVCEIGYIAGIAGLTTFATSDPNHFRSGAWVAAIVLTLPAFLPMLPVLYLSAAVAWNVTGADSGGLRWPVSATYVAALTLTAFLNVVLGRLATNARRKGKLNRAPR